jgi:hypothetical protein
MTNNDTNIVPFGKYKGRDILEVLETDPSYLQWLTGQEWFRDRYVYLHQTIVNRGSEPEDTPEHNALQVLFLDHAFCLKFCQALDDKLDDKIRNQLESERAEQSKRAAKNLREAEHRLKSAARYLAGEPEGRNYGETYQETHDKAAAAFQRCTHLCTVIDRPITGIEFTFHPEFEDGGIDVRLRAGASSINHRDLPKHVHTIGFNTETVWPPGHGFTLGIEIKPTVGDDYPAVLRQMKRNGSTVLFLKSYTRQGATREQFLRTFAISKFRVVFLEQCA